MPEEIQIPMTHSANCKIDSHATVKAVLCGAWALHKSVNLDSGAEGCYALTYRPTGQCIDWIKGTPAALAHALRRVDAVGPPPVDPRRLKPRGKHPAGYTAWVRQIVAAMGEVHRPPVVVDFVGEIRRHA